MATIQIPVLFDMSGDSIVFGEEVSGDFVASHLNFTLDMTTEANDISLNAADISSAILIGDSDSSDNIFYSGGSSSNIAVDNLCNRLAKTITRGKLIHTPKTGDTSNSGIPMGGRDILRNASGVYTGNGTHDKYAIKYFTSIAPLGDEQMLGNAMARVASVHLVGHPLSAGIFQNANQIQTDLETASGQTFNSGGTAFYNALAVQLSKVLGGSKSSAPMNSGAAVTQEPITQTLVKNFITEYTTFTNARAKFGQNSLYTDGTDIYSLPMAGGGAYQNGNTEVLKISPAGVIEEQGEHDGDGAWAADATGVYHNGFLYYIKESEWTAGTGDNYKIQKKATTSPFALTYNVCDLGGNGYCLGLDPSGNIWAFGAKAYKIPISTMTKEEKFNWAVTGGHAAVYHNNGFYVASHGGTGIIWKYDIGANTKTRVAGAGAGADGTTNDDGSAYGGSAPVAKFAHIRQMVIGSGGQYLYVIEGKSASSAPATNRIRAIKISDHSTTTHLAIGTDNTNHFEPRGLTRIGTKLYYSIFAYLTGSGSTPNQVDLQSTPEINTTGSVTYPNDSAGVSCPALKSIYEQLMNVPGRSQIMDTREVTNVPMPSGTNNPAGFPFITGDKLVMFLRPKINFAAQTQPEQHTSPLLGINPGPQDAFEVPLYNVADISGSITTQTYSQSSTQDVALFGFNRSVNGLGTTGNRFFTSAAATYNATTGVHEGSGSTTNVDGSTTVAGEWGQVDEGQLTWANELKLTNATGYTTRMPAEFRLLGSIDGTNWTTLITQSGLGPWTAETSQNFTIASPDNYRYYRYIVVKGVAPMADARTSLGHFDLRGVKSAQRITQGNPGNITALDISGLVTNFTATPENISTAFPGNATTGPEAEPNKWGWMGSANSDSLSLDTTDINNTNVIDLHIWKITITL